MMQGTICIKIFLILGFVYTRTTENSCIRVLINGMFVCIKSVPVFRTEEYDFNRSCVIVTAECSTILNRN